MPRPKFATIDEYIESFSERTQKILEKIRRVIKAEIPGSEEAISYAIPTFKLNGKSVIYFAGFAKHVSIYPIPTGSKSFQKSIEPYIKGKGTVSFLLDKPIPYELVKQIAQVSLETYEKRQ